MTANPFITFLDFHPRRASERCTHVHSLQCLFLDLSVLAKAPTQGLFGLLFSQIQSMLDRMVLTSDLKSTPVNLRLPLSLPSIK